MNLQEYMPAITMALLGGVVFAAVLVLAAIERIKVRRKLKEADQQPPHPGNTAQAGR
jgi:hypothetical protein